MNAGKRLLVERAFSDLRKARKELGESIGYDKADCYLQALISKGGLGARLFEERVLKDGV